MPERKKELGDILKEAMQDKSVTPEKLALLTSIPKRFIDSLVDQDFTKLPARAYVRGYLVKIAITLGIDQEEILEIYKDSEGIKSSGETDNLPENRFVREKINNRFVSIVIIGLIILGYAAFRIGDVLGIPTIVITSPQSDIVNEANVRFEGKISPGDNLTINGEIIYTYSNGSFSKDVSLDPGLNNFEFLVKKFLGRESRVTRQIIYELPQQ